jgi:hypothetical protein|tara:strand:- start:191 stop:412 length:222 start_codon:yes stop_codon:yes gene_type:complete
MGECAKKVDSAQWGSVDGQKKSENAKPKQRRNQKLDSAGQLFEEDIIYARSIWFELDPRSSHPQTTAWGDLVF